MSKSNDLRISVSQLPTNSKILDFVSKLDTADIRARFGRLLDATGVAPLLIPKGRGFHATWAWDEDALIGAAMLVELGNRECELALLVRSDKKRRRVGTRLTLRSFALAQELGADQVIAHVRGDNIAALGLLRSTGFRATSGIAFEMWFSASAKAHNLFGPTKEIAAGGDQF
ncbi:MAG: GNAT family N-acetyltransferase [Rhodobacteraceae bacterium]|nr:GNAT family N-acetyltransferase [Paracoccaceae bacterium]